MPADRDEDQTISAKRLLDLSTFYLTAGIVGVSKNVVTLARASFPDLVANVDKFFSDAFQVHGFKGIARAWAVAQTYPAGSERQVLAIGRVFVALYDVLEKKGLLRSTFASTEDATAAVKLSKVAEHLDDDQKQLDLIGSVRLRGINSRTRKWTRKALQEAGVTAEGFDDLVEEVATATALGQAAAVSGNRIGLDPDADIARQEALGRLDALVEGSSAPEQVLAAAVAEAASAVGKGPLKTKTGQALFAGNTQQEDAMLVRGKAIIAASAGSGKCVTGDTLVTSKSGVHRIDAPLSKNTELVSVDAGTLVPSVETGHWLDNGESPVVEMTTHSGIKLRGTPTHPLLIWNDKGATWVPLQDIKPGDTVLLLPGHADSCGNQNIDPEEAYLLGLWVGNGWLSTDPWRAEWSSTDEFLIPRYYELTNKFWGCEPKTYDGRGHSHPRKDVVQRLVSLGAGPTEGISTSARAKVMPRWLHAASVQERVRFLQGLFDTDGTVSEDRCFEWLSASEALARDVHQMLIGLGIVGMLRPKKVAGYDWTYWRVIVSGDNARALSETIGFRYAFDKQEKLDTLCAKSSNPNLGCYPHTSGFFKTIKEEWKASGVWNGRKQALLMDERWVTVRDYLTGARKPSKNQIMRMIGDLESNAATLLRNLTSFYPDEVVSVTPGGVERVFDYTVPATHSFIANGIVSHNSRVLAAKVVYHAKELGIPTKQIIATSFTRKSSAELIDRIKKYSGDEGIMRGEARDGFGTTHAVAARILDRYLPDRPKKRKIGPKDQGGEFSPGELYKIALAQVRLPGGNGQEPDPNETFFPAADVRSSAPSAPQLSWPKAVFKALEWLQTDAADALRKIPRPGMRPETAKNWDAVRSAMGIFQSIASRRLGPDDLSSLQLMRVREVFRAAGMQVDMHDMTARFISAAAKRDFSAYGGEHPTSANQWFNLDAENDPFYAGVEVTPRQLGAAITRWKGTMLTPGAVWAQAISPEDKMLAAGYGCYEWLRTNDPAYMPAEDGDDHLIGFCRSLIEDAALRARVQARFKVVLADEAQDLSPCQHLMFGLITGAYDPATRALREDGKMTADTYAMIGDDRQSIYAFRGADPDVFIDNSDKRGGEFKTNFLTTNYRSARKIVEAANKLIANNTRQIPMVCEVPADRAEGSVRFASHLGWDAASADITSRIKGSIADGSSSYADFGVGVRTNSEGMQLATAMLEAGIPFKSNKFKPLSNYLIKGTLNWMLLGHTDKSETGLLNSLVIECSQTPKSGIGKATLESALDEKAGDDYLGFLSRGGWQQIYKGESRGRDVVLPFVETMKRVRNAGEVSSLELLQHVLKEVPGLLDLAIKSAGGEDEADEASNEDAKGSGTADGIVDYGVISPLFRLSERFEKPGEFFQYIRQLGVLSKKIAFDDKLEAEDKPNDLNAVTIDTVHGWKGLEVKHMIVPMSSRTFPHMMANIEDERRLAYVAVTRGEESVTILSVQEQMGDRVLPPSQFVGELGCGSGSGVSGNAHDDAWDSLPWHKVIAGWSEMQVDRALTKLNQVLASHALTASASTQTVKRPSSAKKKSRRP